MQDLRRAEDMAGGMQRDVDAAEAKGLAIGQRPAVIAGEILAVAQAHDGQRLARRQHRAMAGAGVIGMAVGDHGAGHRPHRIDEEIARRAIKSLRAMRQHIRGGQSRRQKPHQPPQGDIGAGRGDCSPARNPHIAWMDLSAPPPLPAPFARWFAARGWEPRAHQLSLAARAKTGGDALLIAPTGAGKTLAGFLPSLIDLAQRRAGAHAQSRACTRSISRR